MLNFFLTQTHYYFVKKMYTRNPLIINQFSIIAERFCIHNVIFINLDE